MKKSKIILIVILLALSINAWTQENNSTVIFPDSTGATFVIKPYDTFHNNGPLVYMAITREKTESLFLAYEIRDTLEVSLDYWRTTALSEQKENDFLWKVIYTQGGVIIIGGFFAWVFGG